MKRKLLIILSVCSMLGCRTAPAGKFAFVKGNVKGERESVQMQLMTADHGVPVEYAGTTIASDGSFAFMLEPEEKDGFYYLSDGDSYFRICLEPGKTVEVEWKEGVFSIESSDCRTNGLLKEWGSMTAELETRTKGEVYADFFPRFERVRKLGEEWLSGLDGRESGQKERMSALVELDLLDIFVGYISKYQRQYDSEEQDSPYYRQIIGRFPVQNRELLKQPYGMKLMQNYFNYKQTYVFRDREYPLQECLDELDDPVMKAEFRLNQAPLHDFDAFCSYEENCMLQLPDDSYRARLRHLPGRPVSAMEKGTKAPNLIYADTSGTFCSLSSFKGCFRYVDIWATWCSPCKREIPFLQQLEKDFAGYNIVFASISLDRDRKKWTDFVRTRELGGIQLWAGDWGELPAELELGSVPRFLLIGPDGDWVDVNAPRPSDPELRKMFEKLLEHEK